MTTTAITTTAPISASSPEWLQLKAAATALQALQVQDGSVPETANHEAAAEHVRTITAAIEALAPAFPHDADYLALLVTDFGRWADGGFGVPDFLDSLQAFQPQQHRVERPAAPRGLPDVHPERQQQPPGRGRADRGHLARVHRRPGGGRILQQALRPDPLPGLHPRLRHQLRGAVPGNRRRPRDPHLHLGRHLRRPRGGPLPPRAPRRRGHHLAAAAGGRRRPARGPGADPGNLRDVGPHPRPHPHARRPALRPVHDQAAHALLPLLPRGTALRPDRLPRIREDRKGRGRRSRGPPARQAGPVRRHLRPDLPLRHHRQPGPQLRRPRRPAAVRVDAPAPRPALDRQQAQHRLGRGRRRRG